MAATDFNTILSGSAAADRSGLLQALEARGIYVVADGEDPTDLSPGFVKALFYQGVVFWYDASDGTTAHDGVTCIVTSDGKRFKSDAFGKKGIRFIPVADKDLTAPPGSPAVGDSYIVAAGGTGAWAGKDKQIASWTARGWVFLAPNLYDAAYVIDEGVFYHYNASAVWTSGLPAITIGANTLSTSVLKYAKFGQSVVNQTTDTPPGSPSDGDAYIIGPTPTGAWAGNAAAIARYEGSAWVIYTPEKGWQVYDDSQDAIVVWDGSAWTLAGSGYIRVVEQYDASEASPANQNSSDYAYSNVTAPTSTSRRRQEPLQIAAYASKKAGATLEFHYRSVIGSVTSPVANQVWTVSLQVDTDTPMVDWVPQQVSAGNHLIDVRLRTVTADAAAHDYTIYIHRPNGPGFASIGRRWLMVRELA